MNPPLVSLNYPETEYFHGDDDVKDNSNDYSESYDND